MVKGEFFEIYYLILKTAIVIFFIISKYPENCKNFLHQGFY
jgi:hypothetical protein